MPDNRHNPPRRVTVTVADDRLSAWIRLREPPSTGFIPPTVDEVLAAIDQARVAITDTVRQRAEQWVELCAGFTPGTQVPPELAGEFLIAEGRAPVEAEDGFLEWAPELAASQNQPGDAERVDYFARSRILTVAAGATLGRLVAPKDGQPGVDVFGHPRPPRKPKGLPLKLGPGARLAGDGSDLVVAERAGRVQVQGGQVRVEDLLVITGDVDFNSGSVDACVDVKVHGTVRTNFKVRTTKSLHVDRVIEAAQVEVGENLMVGGGIFGQGRQVLVQVGGSLTTHLINEARVRTGGDLRFKTEILNSRVHVEGRLIGEHGTIIGGDVYAREGIVVRVIGSEAYVSTNIAVGRHVNTLRRAAQLGQQIEVLAQSAAHIRQTVQPLMANLKRLGPAQRERATELLCKADEIETQAEELRAQVTKLMEDGAPRGAPHIVISEIAQPGTRIIFNGLQTRIAHPLHGPVRIELRKVNDATEIVAVNQRTGSVTVLPSCDVDLSALPPDESTPTGKKDERKQPSPSPHPA